MHPHWPTPTLRRKKPNQPNIQGQGWLNKVVSADRLGKLCSSELPQGASDDAPLDSAECDQTIGSRSSTLLSAVLQAPSDIGEEKNNKLLTIWQSRDVKTQFKKTYTAI